MEFRLMQALVFPGQGSQFVGMGKDLYNDFPVCREIFDKANDILGYDLKSICFEGPEELLKQTQNTQPALFVHSLAVFELIKDLEVNGVAGHSLGEYSALTAAGVFRFEDGLKLVSLRGRLMQESGNRNPGTMAAIVGLSIEKITEICESLSEIGIVKPANFNSPGQIVISGDVNAVRKAIELAKQNGAKLAKELVVSGAFHSPLMNYAYENIASELNKVEFFEPKFPVYSNVTGDKFKDLNEIKNLLIEQIVSPVKWQQIVEKMIEDGIDTFIEVGAGKVLTGLIKRINPNVNVINLGTSDEVKQFLENGKSN
ncbi:MAG: ACP S-malonyltransferase [Ignavibacteria bacterium]|nr:ACP S-malonyltransferase [Ignavibacteria bacterium]